MRGRTSLMLVVGAVALAGCDNTPFGDAVDVDGTFLAHRIRIKPADPDKATKIKIKALIDEVDATAGTVTLFNTTVKFTPSTEYKVGT